MTNNYIIAIDQGTSATKCVLVDTSGKNRRQGRFAARRAVSASGWVEQDADEIWQSAQAVASVSSSVGHGTRRSA